MIVRLQAGRGLACALLEGLLTAREASGASAEERSFPYLVVRHPSVFCPLLCCTMDAAHQSTWQIC